MNNLRFEPGHPGYYVILAVVLFCATITVQAAAADDFFAQGLAAARAGQVPEAAIAFENSTRKQIATGALDNLGIVQWQCGHAGAAVLAWEQARWIDPSDARANNNLEFARAVAQLDEPQLKWFEITSTWLPANAWAWMTGAGLWLAAAALVLPGVFRRRRAGWHEALAAMGFIVFLFSLTMNYGVISRMQIGFVVKKDAPLLLTPTHEGEVMFTLTAGKPARELRARGDYFLIRTDLGTGWIKRNEFGLICPPPPAN